MYFTPLAFLLLLGIPDTVARHLDLKGELKDGSHQLRMAEQKDRWSSPSPGCLWIAVV